MNTSLMPPALMEASLQKKRENANDDCMHEYRTPTSTSQDLWNVDLSDIMKAPVKPADSGRSKSDRDVPAVLSGVEDLWNTELSELLAVDENKSDARTKGITPNDPPKSNSAAATLLGPPSLRRSKSSDDSPFVGQYKDNTDSGPKHRTITRRAPVQRGGALRRSRSSGDAPKLLRSALKSHSNAGTNTSSGDDPSSTRLSTVKGRGRSKSPMRLPRGRSKSPMRLPTFGIARTRSSSRPRTSTNGTTSLKRTVSFDKVKVREFQQILEPNPACREGPALALGWNYNEKKEVDLEKYETKRNSNGSVFTALLGGTNTTSASKGRDVSSLSPKARIDKALDLGFTPEQIIQNTHQNQKIQMERGQ